MYVQTPKRVTHGGISTPLNEGGENSDNRATLTLAFSLRNRNNPGGHMATFIPEDFDISKVVNPTEARVIDILLHGLKNNWYIVPNLDIAKENRPYEIDILLLHVDYGVIALEVKGGPIEIRQGQWWRRSTRLDVSPPKQAQNAAYALRDELREIDSSLRHLHVEHGVVLPDVLSMSIEDLLEVDRRQLFLNPDLDRVHDCVIDLALFSSQSQALNEQQIALIVEKIRPDVEFLWDPQSQARSARRTLERIVREQTRALSTLDANRRVLVQGAAGTGKTRLAIQWADRAIKRNDSVLFTCFNIPLGDFIASQFRESVNVLAGYFESVVNQLPGLPQLPSKPEDSSQLENYYGLTLPRHILMNIEKVDVRFDTIIVDEIQDFHAMWVHVLIALLRVSDNSRLLTVGDVLQNVYNREGIQVLESFHPTRAELLTNCRNSHSIGGFLRKLGGAEVATASPEGTQYVIPVSDLDSAVEAVHEELRTMIHDEAWDPKRILIATERTKERDAILQYESPSVTVASHDNATTSSVLCETIHRAKGLEFDAVILVTTSPQVRDQLVYIGASRAVNQLVVIAPEETLVRLGLT
jgi:hypothetical protein